MSPPEASLLDTVVKYGWIVISALLSIVWKQKTDEIKELHIKVATMVPHAVYEKNREEMRQNQISIFDELGEVKTMLARIEGRLEKNN